METKRVKLYDNMKALGIILVVMGHVNEFSLGGANPLWFHFCDSFHMSIFFFVSGLFLFKKFEFTEGIKQVGKIITKNTTDIWDIHPGKVTSLL